MQHGKNGASQSSGGSGIVRVGWWSVAFVTLLAMASASLVIEPASFNELANDATAGGLISTHAETALHPWHVDRLVKQLDAGEAFQRTRCRSAIHCADIS